MMQRPIKNQHRLKERGKIGLFFIVMNGKVLQFKREFKIKTSGTKHGSLVYLLFQSTF